MPRKVLLSASERERLWALPESVDDLIRFYSFSETDLSLIRQRRGQANRIGFALQLCLLRYPGYILNQDISEKEPIIQWISAQVGVETNEWTKYANRQETRREHFQELCTYLKLSPFGLSSYRYLLNNLTDLAMQTDKKGSVKTFIKID